MSFTIILQTNTSEKNRLDKSLNNIREISGVLRNESSIINPTILIEGDIYDVKNCNYMTIPSFARSYFVNNITSIRNNLYEIEAHVDVLTTYKDAIRANTGIIYRQETLNNLYLDDGIFRAYNNPKIITKAFPSGFSNPEFVLAVAGG